MPNVVPYGLRPDWFIVTDEIAKELAYVPGLRHDAKHDVWTIHRSHLPLLGEVGESPASCVHPASTSSASPTFQDGSTLRPYQEEGVEYIRSRRGTLLADGMRVGKTAQAVAAHDPDSGPLVVIGPLPVRSVWIDWMRRRFGPDEPIKVLRGRHYDPDEVDAADLIFAHYDVLPAWASMGLRRRVGTLVFDEGHYLSNKDSKRSQAAMVASADAERVILATGTPLWNKAEGLWSLLTITNQGGAWGTYKDFTARYAGGAPGPYGWTTGKPDPTYVPEFHKRLEAVMLRRRWEDIVDHLPPLTRTLESAPISRKEEIEIDKLAAQIREEMAAGADLSDDTVAGNLARIRRVVAKKKAPVAADLAVRICDEHHPVVVWVWHRDVAETVAKVVRKRGYATYVMTGDYTHRQRDEALDAWRRDPDGALIVSMAVAPAGLDFSHAAHCVVAELDWTPATIAQAVMRTYSSQRPNFEIYVVAEHDVEYRLLDAVIDKSATGAVLGVPAADAIGDISHHLLRAQHSEVDLGDLARRISERIRDEHERTGSSGSAAAGSPDGAGEDGDVHAHRAAVVDGGERDARGRAGHEPGPDRLALSAPGGRPVGQAISAACRAEPPRPHGRQAAGVGHQPVRAQGMRMRGIRDEDFKPTYVVVDVDRVLAETDRAILCQIDGDKHWIPVSEIRDDSEVRREGDFGDLVIPEWLADARGIG